MIQLLIIILFLLLGYGIGFIHSQHLERNDEDFPYLVWWNPLVWFVFLVAIPIHLYQEGWSKTVDEMKRLINEIKNGDFKNK